MLGVQVDDIKQQLESLKSNTKCIRDLKREINRLSKYRMPASVRVFAVPELLEAILLQIPRPRHSYRDEANFPVVELLLIQRVSHMFKDTIRGSCALQNRLSPMGTEYDPFPLQQIRRFGPEIYRAFYRAISLAGFSWASDISRLFPEDRYENIRRWGYDQKKTFFLGDTGDWNQDQSWLKMRVNVRLQHCQKLSFRPSWYIPHQGIGEFPGQFGADYQWQTEHSTTWGDVVRWMTLIQNNIIYVYAEMRGFASIAYNVFA